MFLRSTMCLVCRRNACGKFAAIRVCGSGVGNYNHYYLQYVPEVCKMKVVLIENPKFISFFLRKFYKIKRVKQSEV